MKETSTGKAPHFMVLAAAAIAVAAVSAFGLSTVAIAAVVAAGLAALLLMRPELAIFAVTFSIYTNASFVIAGSLGFRFLTEMLIILLLGVAALDRLHGSALSRALPATLLVIGGYVSTLAISALIAPYPDLALSGAFGVGKQVAVIVALIAVVKDAQRMGWALAGVIAGACMLSGLTVFQSVFQLQHMNFLGFASASLAHIAGEVDSWRITGPVTDPNYYGMVLLTALPIVAERVLAADTTLRRIAFSLAVAAILAALVLTYSRGALVALALLSVVAFWNNRSLMLGVTAVAAAIWVLLLLLSDPMALGLMDRFNAGLQDAGTTITGEGHIQDEAVAGRLSEMRAAIALFGENPVLGVGYDQFEPLYQDTAQIHGLMARGEDRQAHSLFLEILAERGIVGALIYGSLVWFAIRANLQGQQALRAQGAFAEARRGHAIVLCFVAFYAASIFLHDAFSGYFWLLVALSVSFSQAAESPRALRSRIPRTPFAKTVQDR